MALDPDIQEYFDFKYVEGELHIYIRKELVKALGWTDKELEMSFGGIKKMNTFKGAHLSIHPVSGEYQHPWYKHEQYAIMKYRISKRMNCWHCGSELIWGGDQDIYEEEDMNFDMVTNLSCMQCGAYVEVFHRCQPYRPVRKPSRTGRQRDMDAL